MNLWNLDRVKHGIIYELYPFVDESDRLTLLAIAAKISDEGCRVLSVAIDRRLQAEVGEVVRKCSEQQPSRRKK